MDNWMQELVSLTPGAVADLARAITMLGDPIVVLVMIVSLTWRRWLRMSIFVAGSFVLRVLYSSMKVAIGRERPVVSEQIVRASGYAMPSGHAAGVALVATLVVVFFPKFRWIAFVVALLVGWSRVALGVHYPSDVLVGWLLGGLCGVVCVRIAQRMDRETIADA